MYGFFVQAGLERIINCDYLFLLQINTEMFSINEFIFRFQEPYLYLYIIKIYHDRH